MKPITFMINVKNEESRIPMILGHATKWADEVVVIDKGSTDNTVDLVKSYPGVKLFVDSSRNRYGDEDRITWTTFPTHDWIFIGTPSEIPTSKCIETCKQMVDGDYDLITVPRMMYMLGIHSEYSPWNVSHYKFLINRKRTLISNRIHHNFMARNGKEGHVPYSPDCCVYHLTYTSGKYWIESMKDYWQVEAEGSKNPTDDINRCFDAIARHDAKLKAGGEETFLLYLAWNLYHLGTAFFLEEKRRGLDINKVYGDIQDRLMKEWE